MSNLWILKCGCKEACVHPYNHSLRVDNLERMKVENSMGKKRSPVQNNALKNLKLGKFFKLCIEATRQWQNETKDKRKQT